jgi:muramidase (phage lysozyme)
MVLLQGVLGRSLSNLFYKLFHFVICRLGAMWTSLPQAEKGSYYEKAKKAERDHLAKYPSK